MSQKIAVSTIDELETRMVGRKLAETLKGGELIELTGDLGSGKTTFVKGLAEGLGSKDEVTSPSFALKNIYKGKFELQHFDLYRLNESPGLIVNEIKEELADKSKIIVIEWASNVNLELPKYRWQISFQTIAENNRKIIIDLKQ